MFFCLLQYKQCFAGVQGTPWIDGEEAVLLTLPDKTLAIGQALSYSEEFNTKSFNLDFHNVV